MDSHPPLVSVVLLSYQYGHYLTQALASLAAQTHPRWELIAIDDGSTDGSPEILRRFAEAHPGRTRLVVRKEPLGCSAGYNEAFELAGGDYVAFLSADDTIDASRLERQVAALESTPAALLCHSDLEVIDAAGDVVARLENSPLPRHLVPWFVYTRGTPFWTATVMLRGRHWRFSTELQIQADVELWLRVAAAGETIHLPAPLARWRRHGSNLSVGRGARRERARLLSAVRRTHRLDELYPAPIVSWRRWSYRHATIHALASSAFAAAGQGAWGVAGGDLVGALRALWVGFVLGRGRGPEREPVLAGLAGLLAATATRRANDPSIEAEREE